MPARKSSPKGLSVEARLAKNKRIKEAGLATRVRRAPMRVRVYELKIIETNINQLQKAALKGVFQEYKWLRNAALAAERFDLDFLKELGNLVPVVTPSSTEERELRFLGSQMRQGVITELKRNLKALAALKASGREVGKLKFTRSSKSIDLQQYKITYELFPNASGKITKVRVQNIPGRLRVRGGEQLQRDGIEYANAKLTRRADGYYLKVTCFLPAQPVGVPTSEIGVDFGVKTSFTLSTGEEVTVVVEESERLRRLQRKLARQVKGSNGYGRTHLKIQREYQRVSYRRDELARQLVHSWTVDSTVYFQDELISSWKCRGSGSRGSRKIHHGVLGRVKALLRNKPHAVMLPSWVATTAWCPECGNRTAHELSKRTYRCSCGYSAARDQHAARNMVLLGKKLQSLTSGTEGSAGGVSIRLKEQLYAVTEQLAAKPETATLKLSP